MRIRWKLFIALFVLTAGTISLVLMVAEREFHQWIQGEIDARFEAQIDGLLEARTTRLVDVRETCSKLARHPAIKAELKGEDTRSLRPQFMEELMKGRPSNPGRTRPGTGTNRPGTGTNRPGTGLNRPTTGPNRPGPGGNKRGADPDASPATRPAQALGKGMPTVGVVDLDGNPKSFGGPLQRTRSARRRPAVKLQDLPDFIEQGVAYVVLSHEETKRSVVQEVVITRVTDDDGTPLGWFFLGHNAETQVERTFQQAERTSGRDVRSGLVAEDQWFVRDLSEEQAAAINAELSDRFWTSGKPESVEVGGQHLLAIARDLNPGSPMGKGFQVAFFPMDGFVEAIADLRTIILWIGAGAVLLTSIFALLMARRFSQPIAELVAGTERIRQGDLDGSVKVRSKDEFGALATAFNAMTHDLALKERYREVLAKTSDPAVAQQLVEGQLELGGEIRHAAVLFCDIRGFTAMTEGMPPAEVIEFINEHMTALTKLVYLHGGVVDKFVGDLIMAVFGAPNSHGDDALRAARCALEMIQVRHELSSATGRVVEIGIGVAYGELVAGCMGSTDRLNYTVLGDRVNLASRLCSDAGAGEVIVDEAIAAALDDAIHADPRAPVSLKGFSAPVPSFAIRPAS